MQVISLVTLFPVIRAPSVLKKVFLIKKIYFLFFNYCNQHVFYNMINIIVLFLCEKIVNRGNDKKMVKNQKPNFPESYFSRDLKGEKRKAKLISNLSKYFEKSANSY